MIIRILLTLWMLLYLILVMDAHTPCYESVKDTFISLSTLILASVFVTILWSPYIIKLLGG